MVSEIKKKEILTVKEMLDSYNKSIKTATEGLDKITEKYKKLMEEEKKSLKETLADSKSAVKMWEKMFNAFPSEAVKEVLGEGYGEPEFDGAGFTSEDNEPPQAEGESTDDEVVVDGLFSEENMNQDDDQPETEDTETEDVGTEEVQADMSIDEMVEEAETAVEEMKAYPKNDESSDDDDEDWAPVPDDWV